MGGKKPWNILKSLALLVEIYSCVNIDPGFEKKPHIASDHYFFSGNICCVNIDPGFEETQKASGILFFFLSISIVKNIKKNILDWTRTMIWSEGWMKCILPSAWTWLPCPPRAWRGRRFVEPDQAGLYSHQLEEQTRAWTFIKELRELLLQVGVLYLYYSANWFQILNKIYRVRSISFY